MAHLSNGKTTEITLRGGRAEPELLSTLALSLVDATHAGSLWGPWQEEVLAAPGSLWATFC